MKHILVCIFLMVALSFQPLRDRSYSVSYTRTQSQWNSHLDTLNMCEYYIGRPMLVQDADILKAFIERQRADIIRQVTDTTLNHK